eukprot:5900574-Amphidinium_carterae.1
MSVGLPAAVSLLSKEDGPRQLDLLIVGKLLAVPIIPLVVTCIFEAQCLGAWVFFWKGCSDFQQSVRPFTSNELHMYMEKIGVMGTTKTFYSYHVLYRHDLCGVSVARMTRRGCFDAVLHRRLSKILLGKNLHLALTIPALRLLSRRGLNLTHAFLLCAEVWQQVMVLGSCLPLLILLLALLATVHGELLFGRSNLIGNQDSEVSMPRVGLWYAGCLAALLQLCVIA